LAPKRSGYIKSQDPFDTTLFNLPRKAGVTHRVLHYVSAFSDKNLDVVPALEQANKGVPWLDQTHQQLALGLAMA
jgi:hypothetical protein